MPTVLDEGVTIDGDLPPVGALSRTHELPVAKAGLTSSASVLEILNLIERGDLPPDVESALLLAESALQAIADGSISTAMLANGVLSADITGRGKMADKFVVNSKLADMVQATVKGRASGAGTGVPADLDAAALFAILGALVPAKPQTAAGVGQFVGWSAPTGGGYSAPSGGTWATVYLSFNSSNGALYGGIVANVLAGGSVVTPGVAGVQHTGFAWRIA